MDPVGVSIDKKKEEENEMVGANLCKRISVVVRIELHMQWTPSNLAILGTNESVLIGGVAGELVWIKGLF